MDARILAWVGAGSALGGILRFWMSETLSRGLFPLGTLTVNLIGSFLLGFILYHGGVQPLIDPIPRATLGAGLLGGFTTMSAFSVETIQLAHEGHETLAGLYIAATILLCLAAAWVGRWTALATTPA